MAAEEECPACRARVAPLAGGGFACRCGYTRCYLCAAAPAGPDAPLPVCQPCFDAIAGAFDRIVAEGRPGAFVRIVAEGRPVVRALPGGFVEAAEARRAAPDDDMMTDAP